MDYKIAVIKGDGIGPEIVDVTTKILDKVGEKYNHSFNYDYVEAGGVAIDNQGEPLPQKTIDVCKESDSVLLGAVGGWQWDTLPGDQRPERALLGLRGALGLYSNLRLGVLHEELKGACPLREDIRDKGIDIMVVRELTGGIYFGERGRKQTDGGEAAFDTEMYNEMEVERICRSAFEIAMQRKKRITNIDKANVLESSRLWREVFTKVAAEYKDVEVDHLYIDNATMQVIIDPSRFDVIVTSNIFGDIISDEISQLTGSIGMLPSASLAGSGFGMYEPIHGSAPEIAGKDIANPIATVLSAAMMLKYSFKLEEEAKALENAVDKVLKKGYRTADIMSDGKHKVGLKEMGELLLNEI